MGTFCYLTKDQSSPMGKYRVYLCAHRDDLERYLVHVSNLIFSRHPNCAIWYYREDGGEDLSEEVVAESLSQMRLFVVPVTRKLLEGGNRAFELELRYTREHRTPTLLLLEEDSLADAFNETCGHLHCIRQSDTEYDTKISQFLSMLFADQKLIGKIKQSFHATVFLSYRKLDRVHLLRLIDIIHRYDRSIGIWFDDYLTVGENFDREIRSAIRRSDLMAVVITPNMLKVPNYVQQYEYRDAKKLSKKVIPFEFEHTDKRLLNDVLHGIDDCVDVNDEAALIAALRDAIDGCADKNGQTSDQKDYLLGLAYLMGIHVERNAQAGLELIRRAAEAGNYAAMDRLYRMYRTGDSVAVDYKEAIRWKLRSVRVLCKLAHRERYGYRRARYGVAYIEACLELIDYKDGLIEYDFEELDEQFIFHSQGLEAPESASVAHFAADLNTVEQELDFFAATLFARYPTEKVRTAFAKCRFAAGKRFRFSSAEASDAIDACYTDALTLLEASDGADPDGRRITAEIHIARARLIRQKNEHLLIPLFDGRDDCFKNPSLVKAAERAIAELLACTEAALEILKALHRDHAEQTDLSRRLYEAYWMHASTCLIDWRIAQNPFRREDYKVSALLAVEYLRELTVISPTEWHLTELRDRCHTLLYESLFYPDLHGLFEDAEQRALFASLRSVEETLEKNWQISPKYTDAEWYQCLK